MIFTLHLDCSGYIESVLETSKSSNGNAFFDVKLKISPKEHQIIRIMKKINNSINRKFFLCKQGNAVVVRNVTKSNNSNISFFNQCYGSVLEDAKSMSFKLTDMEPMTLSEISEKVEGRYNFTVCIKWTEQEKTIDLKNKDNTTTRK